MSLERMFEDLESRMDHLESEERRAVTEELTRAELSQIPVMDRLRGAVGAHLGLRLRGGALVEGELAEVGADWVRMRIAPDSRSAWVPLGALVMIESLAARVREAAPGPLRPSGLGHELRSLARDRVVVQVATEAGEFRGHIAAVGQDAMDLRLLATGDRLAEGSARRVTILLSAVLVLSAERRD
ncbi:hypothetical protein [Brachybacterium endophyticum]|nr:hypothetical protein [Brachybacterium endophyticum]